MTFKFNLEYIVEHTLDEVILQKANIEKLCEHEIFVMHPEYNDYYVSQYGRCISTKNKKAILLGAVIGGQPDRQYLYMNFSNRSDIRTIGVHRAVAEVFCPNWWKATDKLEAHHIDGNKLNNCYTNLILLPTDLHAAIHKIKKIVLLEDGKIIEYKNPLDLVYDKGIKIKDILQPNDGRRKPIKSDGGYTVYNIRGNMIGYQYYPAKSKSKKNK